MLRNILYALDMVLLSLPLSFPILCILINIFSRRGLAHIRVAYLGYAVCALVVAMLQYHLHMDGPEILSMAGWLFLPPIILAVALAFIMTFAARTNATLWMLCGATVALGFFQLLTGIGIIGSSMDLIARGYVLLVLAACAFRRREWWPASHPSTTR